MSVVCGSRGNCLGWWGYFRRLLFIGWCCWLVCWVLGFEFCRGSWCGCWVCRWWYVCWLVLWFLKLFWCGWVWGVWGKLCGCSWNLDLLFVGICCFWGWWCWGWLVCCFDFGFCCWGLCWGLCNWGFVCIGLLLGVCWIRCCFCWCWLVRIGSSVLCVVGCCFLCCRCVCLLCCWMWFYCLVDFRYLFCCLFWKLWVFWVWVVVCLL